MTSAPLAQPAPFTCPHCGAAVEAIPALCGRCGALVSAPKRARGETVLGRVASMLAVLVWGGLFAALLLGLFAGGISRFHNLSVGAMVLLSFLALLTGGGLFASLLTLLRRR